MKKKILSLLMTVAVLFSSSLPALAVDTGFFDVASDAYYADAVAYCRAHGLMNGTSDATFSPDMTTSRAQFTAILWRQAGSPSAGRAPFSDVPADAYYATATAWASEQGIVSGYSDGRFAPDDPITRAQLVTLLWRSSGSPAATSQTPFADQSAIPSYAATAVAWVQGSGIVSGIPQETLSSVVGGIHLESGNLFDPDGGATRAQTAAILHRYLTMDGQEETTAMPQLTIQVGDQSFTATLEDSETTHALLSRLPMTVTMGELNGNEKFYYLPESLPTRSQRLETIHAGDLMLYGSDCLVLFYETFSSSYRYTRLGSIDDPAGLADALGRGSIEVTFLAD